MTANREQSAAPEVSQPSHAPRRFSNREAEEEWISQVCTTRDAEITIVPAGPGEREALEAFFEHVTPADLYYRFLSGMKHVDEERVDAMVRDDDDLSIDFLALDDDTGDILATAMLVADENFQTAEFALVTRSDAKDKGISWAMLDHAARYAEAMGIKRIFSVQSASQTDALQLERELGFSVRTSPDDTTLMLAEKTF